MKYRMPDFNNLSDLGAYLQSKIDDSLDKEVSQVVKAQESIEVQDKVYDVYPDPVIYERRGYDGGLIDEDNMNHTVQDGTLTVTNDTPLNTAYGTDDLDMSLTQRVVIGTGYMYPYGHNTTGYSYMQPRDFLQATVDALEENQTCTETLKISLNNDGIKTE
jgi:hypothetical protein